MIRNRRLFLVSGTSIFLGVALYLTLVGFDHAIRRILGANASDITVSVPLVQHGLLIGLMILYGLARAWRFHPVVHKPYANWLMTTPWNHRLPLPLGPINLAWQDLLVVAPAFLLARFHLHYPGNGPLIGFLAAYITSAVLAQFFTRLNITALPILVALPATLLLKNHLWWVTLLLAAIYPLAALGTTTALRYFPWKLNEPRIHPHEPATSIFGRLGPVDAKSPAPLGMAFLCSALLGWTTFCFACSADLTPDRDYFPSTWTLFFIVGLATALGRLIVYCAVGFFPPISIAGRFATGKLIIPGYDKVFIVPLLILLFATLIPFLFLTALPPAFVGGVFVFGNVFLALAGGPSLYRWKLTGAHRIPTPSQIKPAAAKSSAQLTLNLR